MDLTALLSLGGASLLVTLLVQVFKQYIPEKYVPILAMVIGVIAVVGATLAMGMRGWEDLGNAALTGILAGLSAIGVYSAQSRVTVPGANRPLLQSRQSDSPSASK